MSTGTTEPQPLAAPIRYLTVQDMLWINLEVTEEINRFDYGRLEEATSYQYGYGTSIDVPKQALRLYRGFLKLRPFARGNEATGWTALMCFLAINGWVIDLPEGADENWLETLDNAHPPDAEEYFASRVHRAPTPQSNLYVEDSVRQILREYTPHVQRLIQTGATALVD